MRVLDRLGVIPCSSRPDVETSLTVITSGPVHRIAAGTEVACDVISVVLAPQDARNSADAEAFWTGGRYPAAPPKGLSGV